MELVHGDALEAQPPQAALTGLAEVFGTAVGRPPIRSRALEPTLRGDDEIVGVGVQRLGDEDLAHLRAIRVGGVDEVDAQLDGAAQHRLRGFAVGRVAPDPPSCDAHRAVAEAVDGEVTADRDRAGRRGADCWVAHDQDCTVCPPSSVRRPDASGSPGYARHGAAGIEVADLKELNMQANVLWIIAVVIAIIGVIVLISGSVLWGIILLIIAALVGPGGVSIFNRRV